MEADLDIYRRTLDLFSTIDEAVDYIVEKTKEGAFEICLKLLKDIRAAIDEIDYSLGVLTDRVGLEFAEKENKYLDLVNQIERLELSFGNVDVTLLVNMVEKSLGASLLAWRKEIINTVGQTLSS